MRSNHFWNVESSAIQAQGCQFRNDAFSFPKTASLTGVNLSVTCEGWF